MISQSVQDVVAFLNPIFRGWWQYFRWGRSGRKAAELATMFMNGWLCLTRINDSAAVAGGTRIMSSGLIV